MPIKDKLKDKTEIKETLKEKLRKEPNIKKRWGIKAEEIKLKIKLKKYKRYG